MREDTVTTKVYKFNELSDEAKVVAIQKFSDLNVNFDWWDGTYEDAATIGLEIQEFDVYRGICNGSWTEDAEAAAKLIMENHGEACETYKDAETFLNDVKAAKAIFEVADDYDPDYEEFDESDEHEELCQEFKKTILEDYRILLQQEYEYRTSEAAIIEGIEANEYEFTEDGKHYS